MTEGHELNLSENPTEVMHWDTNPKDLLELENHLKSSIYMRNKKRCLKKHFPNTISVVTGEKFGKD